MATKKQQLDIEMEKLLPPEEEPPEYETATAQHSFPAAQPLQQPIQAQEIVHVNNRVPYPKDYFIEALLVTLCCCVPFGIAALVKSHEVGTRAASGDYEGAVEAAKSAKFWSSAGLLTGAIVLVIYFMLQITAAIISEE